MPLSCHISSSSDPQWCQPSPSSQCPWLHCWHQFWAGQWQEAVLLLKLHPFRACPLPECHPGPGTAGGSALQQAVCLHQTSSWVCHWLHHKPCQLCEGHSCADTPVSQEPVPWHAILGSHLWSPTITVNGQIDRGLWVMACKDCGPSGDYKAVHRY